MTWEGLCSFFSSYRCGLLGFSLLSFLFPFILFFSLYFFSLWDREGGGGRERESLFLSLSLSFSWSVSNFFYIFSAWNTTIWEAVWLSLLLLETRCEKIFFSIYLSHVGCVCLRDWFFFFFFFFRSLFSHVWSGENRFG
jgi:hypothetical protein